MQHAIQSDTELAAAVREGAEALGLHLGTQRIELLACYLVLLAKWNRVYNLTATRDARAMIAPHLLDSLSVHFFIKGPCVLDVGSGAGMPGIPLAVVDPDIRFVLIDSNAKKTRFMQQAAIELGLVNVCVLQCRVESYRPRARFDTVICRAFASLQDFVAAASHACAVNGRLLAMKGALSADEQRTLETMSKQSIVHKLQVPGIAGERHLVEISTAQR